MPRELFSPNKTIVPTIPEPVELGGTGATTALEACQNLHLLSVAELNQVNGVAQLNANNLVKTANIPTLETTPLSTVDGDVTVYTGQVCKFIISNYDSLRTYTLTALSGSVSLVTYEAFNQCVVSHSGQENTELPGAITACDPAGTIIFTAPNTPGATGFVLNGVTYDLNVQEAYIAKPVLLTPTNNEVWDIRNLIVTAQQPVVLGHQNDSFTWELQYQLAEDNAFTINLQSVTTANLDATFNNLSSNKLYYIRMKAAVPGSYSESEWSNVVSFATPLHFNPFNEMQIINPPLELSINTSFGGGCAISNDGTVLVIGDPTARLLLNINGSNNNYYYGAVYIYLKQNNSWILNKKFNLELTNHPLGITDTNSLFGNDVYISDDKQTIIVTAPTAPLSNGEPGPGYIYAFKTTVNDDYSTISYVDKFSPSPLLYTRGFGFNIAVSSNCQRLVVSQYFHDPNNHNLAVDKIFMLNFNGIIFSEMATFVESWQSDNVTISGDGNTVAINRGVNILGDQLRIVHLYKYDGSNWNLAETIDPFPGTGNAVLALSFNGAELIVISTSGVVTCYVYRFVVDTWVLDHQFTGLSDTMNSSPKPPKFTNDGNFLIYGSSNSGVVTLLKKINNVWTLFHTYTIESGVYDGFKQYGTSVDISEDGESVIIGAPARNLWTGINANVNISVGGVYVYG